MHKWFIAAALATTGVAVVAEAQAQTAPALPLERVFAAPDLAGPQPRAL